MKKLMFAATLLAFAGVTTLTATSHPVKYNTTQVAQDTTTVPTDTTSTPTSTPSDTTAAPTDTTKVSK